jgi:hypothetical protein
VTRADISTFIISECHRSCLNRSAIKGPIHSGAYECALDIFTRELGPDHPNTGAAATSLAALSGF